MDFIKKAYRTYMVTDYFLDNLRALMKVRGDVKQAELAEAIGASKTTVSNWWRRHTLPSDEHIDAIANYFNVKPHYFFMEPGTQGELTPLSVSSGMQSLLNRIASELEPLDEDEWKRMGGSDEFARMLEYNFDHDRPVSNNWFRKMRPKFLEFVSIDPLEKMNKHAEKIAREKAQALKRNS